MPLPSALPSSVLHATKKLPSASAVTSGVCRLEPDWLTANSVPTLAPDALNSWPLTAPLLSHTATKPPLASAVRLPLSWLPEVRVLTRKSPRVAVPELSNVRA